MKFLLQILLFTVAANSFADKNLTSTNVDLKYHLKSYNTLACDKSLNNCLALGFISADGSKKLSRVSYASEDGGNTWLEATALPQIESADEFEDEIYNASLSCDEHALKCLATHLITIDKIPNTVVYKTLDGGKTWSNPEIIPIKLGDNNRKLLNSSATKIESTYISSSCDPSTTLCMIAGGINTNKVFIPFGFSSTDSGNTWLASKQFKRPYHHSPSNMIHGTSLLDVTCDQTGKRCKAVGNTIARNSFWNDYFSSMPVVYSSNNTGRSFGKPHILPTRIRFARSDTLQKISCNKTGEICTVVGFTYHGDDNRSQIFAFTTENGGQDWSKKIIIPTKSPLEFATDLTCDAKQQKCIITAFEEKRINSLDVYKAVYYVTDNSNKKQWSRRKLANDDNYGSQIIKKIVCDEKLDKCIAAGFGNNN